MDDKLSNRIKNLWLESERLWKQSSTVTTQESRVRNQICSAWLGANFITISDALPRDLIIKAFECKYVDQELALLLFFHKSNVEEKTTGLNTLFDLMIKYNGPNYALDYLDKIQSNKYTEEVIDSICQEFAKKHNFAKTKQIISLYFGKGYTSFRLLNNSFKVLSEEEQENEFQGLIDEAIYIAETETFTTAIDLFTYVFENLKTEKLRSDFYLYIIGLEKSNKIPALRPIDRSRFGDYKGALIESLKNTSKDCDAQDELSQTISNAICSESIIRDSELYVLTDKAIKKVIDEEERNKLEFGILLKKHLLSNFEYFILEISKMKDFLQRGKFLDESLKLLIKAKRYDLVTNNVGLIGEVEKQIDILSAILESKDLPNSVTTNVFRIARKIIDQINNPLERIVFFCRILTSLKKNHEIQDEQKILEEEFYDFILSTQKRSVDLSRGFDFVEVVRSSQSNMRGPSIADLTILLAQLGLIAEALLATDLLEDNIYCEQSRNLCQICEILVRQNLLEKALSVSERIEDKRWKENAKRYIALGYLNENMRAEALNLINHMEYIEIKSITLKDAVVTLAKRGEIGQSLELFSKIIYRDDKIIAMESLLELAVENLSREMILNKLFIDFTNPVIMNTKDITEAYIARINRPINKEEIKKELLTKKENLQRLTYERAGFNYEADRNKEIRKGKLNQLFEVLVFNLRNGVDDNIQIQQNNVCLALFAFDMYNEGGCLLDQIENKDLHFSVLSETPELLFPNNPEIGAIYLEKLNSFLRENDLKYFKEFLRKLNLLEFIGSTALLEYVLTLINGKNSIVDITT